MTATTPLTATSATATTPTGSNGSAPANPNGMLGQNDFLKLMVAQLQSQDPLQPANSNEYISELAQFTQVEQITNLANSGQLSDAVQLIGHTVSYNDPSGVAHKGTVQSVQSTASGTTVTVEGASGVKQSSITEVS